MLLAGCFCGQVEPDQVYDTDTGIWYGSSDTELFIKANSVTFQSSNDYRVTLDCKKLNNYVIHVLDESMKKYGFLQDMQAIENHKFQYQFISEICEHADICEPVFEFDYMIIKVEEDNEYWGRMFSAKVRRLSNIKLKDKLITERFIKIGRDYYSNEELLGFNAVVGLGVDIRSHHVCALYQSYNMYCCFDLDTTDFSENDEFKKLSRTEVRQLILGRIVS